MTTTLQRLLKYPHAAVFDKDPIAEVAFRLQHPDGAAWLIADGQLRATVADDFYYDLSQYTVSELVEALQDDGFDVVSLSPAIAPLSALVLIDGAGDHGVSNGDQIKAFTSILWALLSAYAREATAAGEQVRQALRQMVITQAEGEWLDLWGSLYAVARRPGELDAAYAARIPREAFRLRVNARAIEQAILDATGYDVRITEPWRDIFTLDESLLSGPDKLYDGVTAGYHLIRPETRQSVDWDAVNAVIERNRAAGVLALQARSSHGTLVDGSGAEVTVLLSHNRRTEVINEDRALLDYMQIEDLSILNHASRRLRTNVRRSQVVVDFSDFDVAFEHKRTFRTYYLRVFYDGQFWLPHVTWANADVDWDADAIVISAHKRS